MSNSKKIDELAQRATQQDEELLPLIMPESNDHTSQHAQSQDKPEGGIDEDEDLDNASARKKLIESLTDDEGEKSDFSLSYVLRGDILTTHWLRSQLWWLLMVLVLTFLYVSNRYYAQKQLIHINQLKEELKETHYDAMARSSQLMRNCRRSNIVEKLTASGSTLAMPQVQPAIIPNE